MFTVSLLSLCKHGMQPLSVYFISQLLERDDFSFLSDHPGVCPRPQYAKNPEFCATARFATCSDDSQCKRHEKCCSNGCARVCTPVIQENGKMEMIVCHVNLKPQCRSDYDCPWSHKCCKDNCGLRCIKPLGAKPGQCPPSQHHQSKRCPLQRPCSNDFDCPKDGKCCKSQCGPVCTPPFQNRPGVCPRPEFAKNKDFCATARFAICSHDSQCKKHEKCCDNGCAPVCTPVIQDHPGACPRPTYCGNPRICPAVIFPSCSHDSQCKEHEKCCDNGCARVCMSAEKGKMKMTSHYST
uniref:WAP domain-containing protein n=1 Tax=Salarias fasciatus TaxID=181472 RepID=A0A672IRF7_SALFA